MHLLLRAPARRNSADASKSPCNVAPAPDDIKLARQRARWISRRFALTGLMAATIAAMALGDRT